jgi:proline iminopeptidase
MTDPARSPAAVEILRFVSSGPARLFVREVGAGTPIVVVHGGPDFDHEYLLPELDRLAEQFRVVYYDQRGRGRSFTGETADDVTIESEIEDLDRVRESIRADAVAVLGHSWGALLAMEYAIRHPDRVSRLILMNSAPPSRVDAVVFRRALQAMRTQAEGRRVDELRVDPAYLSGDVQAVAEFYRIHFRPAVRDREQLDRVVGRLRIAFSNEGIVAARAIEDSLYGQTWSREEYDLVPALGRLDAPTLVIHGDRDFIPVEIARHVASAIRGSRLLVLADCGHFAFMEQPALVCEAIADLVSGTPEDGTIAAGHATRGTTPPS